MEERDASAINISRGRRFAHRFIKLPHYAIALTMLLPVWVFAYCLWPDSGTCRGWLNNCLFSAVLFLPGAIKRQKRSHILLMLGFAGAWIGLRAASSRWPLNLPFFYNFACWAAASVAIVAIAEWLRGHPRSWQALAWLVVLSLAVGCLVILVQQPLNFVESQASIPTIEGGRFILSWGSVAYWPLLVGLAWVAVPAGLRLGSGAGAKGRIAAASAALACIAAFMLFSHAAMYRLARQSLAGSGPFARHTAPYILAMRGNQSDLDAIENALQDADWTVPPDYTSWDYRRACVGALATCDPRSAADRLSKMVRDKPSSTLATFCAELLADQRRYEAVPVLMRYALSGFDGDCTEALERMKVPEAALAIIHWGAVFDRPNPLTEDFPLSPERRQRLARPLGKDVGPNLSDWTACYDSLSGATPSPLPDDVAKEMKRVVQAVISYWTAVNRLHVAESELLVRRIREAGHGKYLDEIAPFEPLLRGQRRLTDADARGIDRTMMDVLDRFSTQAHRDMAVSPPDWDVRTTADLEREVREYARRVDAIIAAHRPATTMPSAQETSLKR